jgi:hypothetical protein
MTTALAALADIPALPESFGPGAGAETAQRALAENAPRDDDETHDENTTGAGAPGSTSVQDTPAGTGAQPEEPRRRGRGRPPGVSGGHQGAPADDRLSTRKVKRMKRAVLEDRLIATHERAEQLATENLELTRRVAVVQAVGVDVVDEGVRNLVEGVVDLLDSGAQIFVPPHLAKVVALEVDERARLVKLGAPLAKMQLGAYVEKSPLLAFLLALGSISLGKVVAYKLAQIPAVAVASEAGNADESHA